LHRAELTVCCRLIRCSWHGASCLREILRFSTVSSPEVQKRKGADVDFQAVWVHVSNQEHQVSPRGASDCWRESVRKSVSRLVKGQCTCSSGFSTGLSHRVGWCFKWDSSLAERVSVRSGFHFPAQNATWTLTWCQEQGLSDRLHLTPAQA